MSETMPTSTVEDMGPVPITTTYAIYLSRDDLWVVQAYTASKHKETNIDLLLLRETKAYDIYVGFDRDMTPMIAFTLLLKFDTVAERIKIDNLVRAHIKECWEIDEYLRNENA